MIAPSEIQAFGPWVLIEADPHKDKTAGGIYRPQGNLEDRTGMRVGTVISVGQGQAAVSKPGKPAKSKYIPTDLEIGDRILFRGFLHDVNKYHQGIEGLSHSLVNIDDILVVIEDEDGDLVL